MASNSALVSAALPLFCSFSLGLSSSAQVLIVVVVLYIIFDLVYIKLVKYITVSNRCNKKVLPQLEQHFYIALKLDFFKENYRSEEHTSELQSRPHLVCRLLLEKKKKKNIS